MDDEGATSAEKELDVIIDFLKKVNAVSQKDLEESSEKKRPDKGRFFCGERSKYSLSYLATDALNQCRLYPYT